MIFKEVKQILIPEGDVIKITDSNNVILWKKYFTITYIGGGTHTNPLTAVYGQKIYLTNASKDGYVFQNWTDENGDVVTSITVTSNRTITANYKQIFSISYITKGGTHMNPLTATYGDTITLGNAALNDWEFYNWTDENGYTVPSITVTSNRTITANYKALDTFGMCDLDGITLYDFFYNGNTIKSDIYEVPFEQTFTLLIGVHDEQASTDVKTREIDKQTDKNILIHSLEFTFWYTRINFNAAVQFLQCYVNDKAISVLPYSLNWFKYKISPNESDNSIGYLTYSICEFEYVGDEHSGYYNHVTNADLGILKPCIFTTTHGYCHSWLYNTIQPTASNILETKQTTLYNLLKYTHIGLSGYVFK